MSTNRSGSVTQVRCGNCGADLGYPYNSASGRHVCTAYAPTPTETELREALDWVAYMRDPEGYQPDNTGPTTYPNDLPLVLAIEAEAATPAETGLDIEQLARALHSGSHPHPELPEDPIHLCPWWERPFEDCQWLVEKSGADRHRDEAASILAVLAALSEERP